MLPVLEVCDCSSGADVYVGAARCALKRVKTATAFSHDAAAWYDECLQETFL